jgi:putative ABC transport system ATP-binding protein
MNTQLYNIPTHTVLPKSPNAFIDDTTPQSPVTHPLIEGKNIYRTFSSGGPVTKVLNGISITINEGEFVGIMGRSGAGKSTLLYQLSGLDTPNSGDIYIAGTHITELSKKEIAHFRLCTLGFIFQDYALIGGLNVLENIMLPLRMRGIPWRDAQHTAERALATVGLQAKVHNATSHLSGGEQQRVAIARALAGKPKIIFADEPTANLDSHSGQQVIELLGKLHSEGQTIVMVTHEAEYTSVCSRIITVEDGMVAHEETRRSET